jgi:hypothetical protein
VKEDASAKAIPSPFERPFLDLWTPARADEAVPALIINTTEVANGYRIVMSPIGMGAPANKQWSKIARLHSLLPPATDAGFESDVKLSTAAGMSARFPWVLPAATVETGPDLKPMRLVDGGYVESSGVDSASQLLKALKVAVDRTKDTPDAINAKFYLVVLMGYEGTPVEDRSLGAPAAATAHAHQHVADARRDRVPLGLRGRLPGDRHVPRAGRGGNVLSARAGRTAGDPCVPQPTRLPASAHLAADAGKPRDHRAACRHCGALRAQRHPHDDVAQRVGPLRPYRQGAGRE